VVENERGSALLVALVTVLVVTMSLLLVASFIQGQQFTFEIEERNVMIATLVDGAMAETLANLSNDEFFRGISSRNLGKGTISSEVTKSKKGHRRIRAVGTFKRWSATIDAEVRVSGPRPVILHWQYRQGPIM